MRGWNTTSPSDRMATWPSVLSHSMHVERFGIQAIGKRIVDQVRRQVQHVRIARVLVAIALQGAEVVGVAQLVAQLLEDLPVALRPLGPDLARPGTARRSA